MEDAVACCMARICLWPMTVVSPAAEVLILGYRICLRFRISDLGFPDWLRPAAVLGSRYWDYGFPVGWRPLAALRSVGCEPSG